MDGRTYQDWWPLHLRIARGEKLSREERIRYEEGLRELDREESDDLRGDVTRVRELRDKVVDLESRLNHVHERQDALQAQISGLEALLRGE